LQRIIRRGVYGVVDNPPHYNIAEILGIRRMMKDTNNELYNLIKGTEKIKEIDDFLSYVCI